MLDRLLERYDPEVFSVGERTARVRIVGASEQPVDVVLSGDAAPRTEAAAGRADAVLQADAATWGRLGHGVAEGRGRCWGPGRVPPRTPARAARPAPGHRLPGRNERRRRPALRRGAD